MFTLILSPVMILLLDNYDSFTFNLFHLVGSLTDEEVVVKRNDAMDPDTFRMYSRILLSPGPGLPESAGVMLQLILKAKQIVPVLGVCLGHQAIGTALGGKLLNLKIPFHGVAEKVIVQDRTDFLFDGVPEEFAAGRYHSWVLDPETISGKLSITAIDGAGNIMGISDASGMLKGIQFHPESIMTQAYGSRILANWLRYTGQE
jgi:anthranilate synthase component II